MHQSAKPEDLGGSRSLWMRSAIPSSEDVLGTQAAADVCIIGAGIAGLTTAYECLTRGHTVIVLDGGTVGGGETLRTTAHLTNALDDHFVILERRHGLRGSRLLAEGHGAAIDWIEAFCASNQVACGFARVDGYMYGAPETTRDDMLREVAAARRAGLDAELVEAPPVLHIGKLPAIRFAAQAQLDPGAYIAGLAAAVHAAGGRIYEGVVVERVDEGTQSTVIAADGRKVLASHVVVATNAPITSMVSIPLKQAAYRSYVVAFEIPKREVLRALYWDMEHPYHYVRVADGDDADHDLLLVGGEDHKTGQNGDPDARLTRLARWARERFPFAGSIRYRWSGQIMEPADGIGFIGRNPGSTANTFIITGDSGDGLTLGTLGARIVTDLIEGRSNAWADVFAPSRSMLHAVTDFVRENANVAAQYLDLVGGGDVPTVDDVIIGEGAIVREGARLLAVFRDEQGNVHASSALCPHLEGVVHWNGVEKSWDCPCHGSRFDRYGRVIAGPAVSNLSPATYAKTEPMTTRQPRAEAHAATPSANQVGRRDAYAQQLAAHIAGAPKRA